MARVYFIQGLHRTYNSMTCSTCTDLDNIDPTLSAAARVHLHELHTALEQAHSILEHLQPRNATVRQKGEITRAYVTLQDVELCLQANGHLAPVRRSQLARTLG